MADLDTHDPNLLSHGYGFKGGISLSFDTVTRESINVSGLKATSDKGPREVPVPAG